MEKKYSQENKNKNLDFILKHYREGFFNTKKAWNKFSQEKNIKVTPVYLQFIKIAAIIMMIIIPASIFWTYENRNITITTANNETRQIYLPDNTSVTLYGNSELKYNNHDFNKNERAVFMEGNIFYDVTGDSIKRFRIETHTITIEVLGTSFNVNSGFDNTMIDVKSGKVNLKNKISKQECIITAGMSAEINHHNHHIIINDLTSKISISSGNILFQFEHTPLNKVVDQLTLFFNKKIDYEISDSDLLLTATFENMTIENIIEVINETLDIQISIVK